MKSYVGITGYKTTEEVKHSVESFRKLGFGNDKEYTGMLGILATKKNLDNPMRVGSRAPSLKEISTLMKEIPSSLLPVIHYCSYNYDSIGEETIKVFEQTGVYNDGLCKTVQINNEYWPNISQIEKVKEKFPEMNIILQIPTESNETNDASLVAKKTAQYSSFIDAVLVDPSAGRGMPFGEQSLELLTQLNDALPNTLIGIAGGLTPYDVGSKINLINQTTNSPFFIDIEGKVRTADGNNLDFGKVEEYIANSAKHLF